MRSLIADYISHGWQIVPVPEGSKGPRAGGWNTRSAALQSMVGLPDYMGVGLMHAYSGTMALDIDDWMLTRKRIDIDALYAAPDAVTILSGKPGRGKLLYRMPFGLVLPTRQFKDGGTLAFELRCATMDELTVQDVLPPSIHPETRQPYQWGGAGHWTRLPFVPSAVLDIWQAALVDARPALVDGVSASWDEIRGALAYINPDCSRDDWIACGFALHWAGEQTFNAEGGFHVWYEWSKLGEKFPGDREMGKQWSSFRSAKNSVVTIGSLFHLARQAGWVRQVPDAASLFGPIEPAQPTDIMALLRPSPPPVDLDLWPGILAKRAQEVSDGVGCDPLVPLFAGLAAVCGAIDARTRLEMMPGFKVPPVLWLMTLGDPADKKSPGSRPMLEPLAELEMSDRPRYARELSGWEVREAAYAKSKKALLEFAGSDKHQLGAEGPQVLERPDPPVPLVITLGDVTSQKMVHLAVDRPRGMLCYLDEMNSWVGKVCNRMSGEDRSCWVVSYEASRYKMDRVGAGSLHTDNFAVSIYGNIQPRVLHENFDSLTQDGLLQRFLPAVLRPNQTRLGNPVPDFMTSTEEWSNVLRLVYAMPATTYRLSSGARAAFRAFQVWYEQRKQTERLVRASATYMTAYGKLEGLVGRLALLFHAIENPFSNEVPASVIERAIAIVRGYVIPVYRHLYDNDDTSSTTFDTWIMEHIIHFADTAKITMSDIKKSARRPFERAGIKHPSEQSQWVINAMGLLEEKGWVARADDGSMEHRGVAEWLINPHLKDTFANYRKAVIKAKVERADIGTYGHQLQRVHGEELLEQG